MLILVPSDIPCMTVPDSQVTLHTQLHEPLERWSLQGAPHHSEHFLCQFDVWLPPKIASRGTFKHEAKVCREENEWDELNRQGNCKSRSRIYLDIQ